MEPALADGPEQSQRSDVANSEPASKRELFDYSNGLQTVSNPKPRIIEIDYSEVKNGLQIVCVLDKPAKCSFLR